MPLAAGTRLGTYEIIAPLGAGGMGEVYRARDARLGREVALKVLPTEFVHDPDRLARFEREARAVAALNHPNIVVLYAVEHVDDVRFLAMELVEGQSLDRHMSSGGLPLGRVLDVGIPLADALTAAHDRGVVHRDLKPANVMLSADGRVKVLDFGLARQMSVGPEGDGSGVSTVTAPLTREGVVMGTVPHMAPEQLLGEATDARTDVFALGILLYQLATGRHPFRGSSAAELISSILRDAPAPAHLVRQDLPADLGRIIARCLEKDPDRRMQTARDVRNELERMRRGTLAGPQPLDGAGEVPSVAVLPFTTTGHGDADDDFALGITEDLIAHLCKVRRLRVISRASVMAFRARDVALDQIAARLDVAHVLDGSVRRAGDRVRIVAELVDGATGRSLWAETYDRRLTDIFEIQTDVALRIAAALEAELSPTERERIKRSPTPSLEAYEDYVRGRTCYVRYSREGVLESIEHFDRALVRDPGFALAHVGRAISFSELVEIGASNREQAATPALSSGAKAVALAPDLGEAHCALAYTLMLFEFDWSGAEAGFRRALELSPGYSDAYALYGRMLAAVERYDEAIAIQQRAYELDPLSARSDMVTSMVRAGRHEEAIRTARRFISRDPEYTRLHTILGWALFRTGREDEGIAELQRGVALSPNEPLWLAQLGQAYGLIGRREEALDILRRLDAWPTPVSPYHLAYVHVGLGDFDRALDHLEQAFDLGTGATMGLKGSFLFAPLRGHPRHTALLKRIRLG